MPYHTTIASEEARLERIEESPVIGICFLDTDGRLVQLLDDDPELRDVLIEHQKERIRQLRLSEPVPKKLTIGSMLSRQKINVDE